MELPRNPRIEWQKLPVIPHSQYWSNKQLGKKITIAVALLPGP
jgi:hypothetical protein